MQNTKVWLIDEKHNCIEKSDINFAPVIKALQDIQQCEKNYPFLVGIDPYGHTYFNVHQAPKIIEELVRLQNEEISESAAKEIINTIEFLKKVEQHTFVNFIGD